MATSHFLCIVQWSYINSFVGALFGAFICAVIIWNKKSLVILTAIVATLVLILEAILRLSISDWTDLGYTLRYAAIIIGFILVPFVIFGVSKLINFVQHNNESASRPLVFRKQVHRLKFYNKYREDDALKRNYKQIDQLERDQLAIHRSKGLSFSVIGELLGGSGSAFAPLA